MAELVRSEWFALVTGLASVCGVLIAIYQIRVRFRPHSQIRTMEWQKAWLIGLGIGITAASGVRFYFQELPPTFQPARDVYDFLHGTRGTVWQQGSHWFYGVGLDRPKCHVQLTNLDFESYYTRAYFRVTPFADVKGLTETDIFSNPLMGPKYGRAFKSVQSSLANNPDGMFLQIDFPALVEAQGPVVFSADSADHSHQEELLTLTNDERQTGSSIWSILTLLGIAVAVFGFSHDPFESYKKKLITEGKDLHNEQFRELDKILGGRQYEELSAHEKLNYDDTRRFYRKSQALILKTLSGHDQESSDDAFANGHILNIERSDRNRDDEQRGDN